MPEVVVEAVGSDHEWYPVKEGELPLQIYDHFGVQVRVRERDA